MVNLDEINGEIAKLEAQTATYTTMERLAWLYIVRDHITISNAKTIISDTNMEIIPEIGTSDFLLACVGKSTSDVMKVMDELMETLKAMQPRLYKAVMSKL